MSDFEVVSSRRMNKQETATAGRTDIMKSNNNKPSNFNGGHLVNAIADNFDNILRLASDITDIQRMKVQSEAVIRKMQEDREHLIAEAEAYAKKKNADTNNVVAKMSLVREMMKDFYVHNNTNLTGEEFSKIISSIITEMGRL